MLVKRLQNIISIIDKEQRDVISQMTGSMKEERVIRQQEVSDILVHEKKLVLKLFGLKEDSEEQNSDDTMDNPSQPPTKRARRTKSSNGRSGKSN